MNNLLQMIADAKDTLTIDERYREFADDDDDVASEHGLASNDSATPTAAPRRFHRTLKQEVPTR